MTLLRQFLNCQFVNRKFGKHDQRTYQVVWVPDVGAVVQLAHCDVDPGTVGHWHVGEQKPEMIICKSKVFIPTFSQYKSTDRQHLRVPTCAIIAFLFKGAPSQGDFHYKI